MEVGSVRKAYIIERKKHIEWNMSFFIIAIALDYIPTKIIKLSDTKQIFIQRLTYLLEKDNEDGLG